MGHHIGGLLSYLIFQFFFTHMKTVGVGSFLAVSRNEERYNGIREADFPFLVVVLVSNHR